MFANPNQPGSYVGWTPCSTLRYRLNLAAAPATATADVTEALRRITLLTGLRFSYLGTTDYVPSATTPGTYPTDTDLVITWSDAATVPVLAGSVIGVGGAYVTYSAPAHLLRGGVSLDRQAGLPAGFGSGATMGALLLHEVGHVLGLGHETMDLLQVMYPALTASATPWYQAGDRAGLARFGSTPLARLRARSHRTEHIPRTPIGCRSPKAEWRSQPFWKLGRELSQRSSTGPHPFHLMRPERCQGNPGARGHEPSM